MPGTSALSIPLAARGGRFRGANPIGGVILVEEVLLGGGCFDGQHRES